MKIFAGILAGGTGMRMSAGIPKQFLELSGKPIIIHTIEKFLVINKFEKVVVAIHPEWIAHFEDLIDMFLSSYSEHIMIVEGGKDRNDTIINVINRIEKEYILTDEDSIVTHDSVRPFVTMRIINDNIKSMMEFEVVDTVVPATDTIVVSNNAKEITDIPRRDYMYQGQTPQSFRINKFKMLYNNLTNEEKSSLTDACKIFVANDYKVGLIQGEFSNIKLTTVVDLKIANALLED